MAELPDDDIDRINALTSNARNTWFVLLGALVFVGITLMGVEHIDFYGVDRATKLPLVDVEVPTRYFFVAAPILTAALYGYFHLYLIRLWDALSASEPRHGKRPLGDAISPWLVIDAALNLRRLLRRKEDPCATPRAMDLPSMVLNFLLSWVFGLIILALLWRQSFPARDFVISAIAGLSLALSIVVCLYSFAMLLHRMRAPPRPPTTRLLWNALQGITILIWCGLAIYHSHKRTEGRISQLADIVLSGEALVGKPASWLPYELAQKDFRAKWCGRERPQDCNNLTRDEADALGEEWQIRRQTQLDTLSKPKVNPIYLPRYAGMDHAMRIKARKKGLDLRAANLRDAFMAGMNLVATDLTRAVLVNANLEGADLRWSSLQGAMLFRTSLKTADLSGANLQGAILTSADFRGADLGPSFIAGIPQQPVILNKTILDASTNESGAMRYVRFANTSFDAQTDFRNAFLDGSVRRPKAFDRQMGYPCQWAREAITDDKQFFGRWRGWVQQDASPQRDLWYDIAPPDWRHVPAIAPPEGCRWKTGPMPVAGE